MQSNRTLVVVRDHDQCQLIEQMDDWDATTLLASVSSDPRSFRELGLAWLRYRKDTPLETLPWQPWAEGVPHEVKEWLVIDLANLRLESNHAEAIPDEQAAYTQSKGEWSVDNPLVWFNPPPEWQRVIATASSPTLQPLAARKEPLDFRGVLFGRAMAVDFSQRMQRLVAHESVPAEHYSWDDLPRGLDRDDPRRDAANRWHELTLQVHAAWLTDPRDDLDRATPRDFLHRGRTWVEQEVENRSRQWSRLKTPPRPLDRDTFAFIHGPMGRDEVVVYYDYCRRVLHAGWRMFCKSPDIQNDLNLWSNKMYERGRDWLKEGRIDDDCPTPPADIITCGRRHMPQLADGTHLDCDCSICQMIAENQQTFYPTFAFFDGHHLETEGEFAFSLCETREEWEQQESAYDG